MNLGPTELVIILVIVLVIFGGSKLPKLARSMGQAQKEFKKGLDEGDKSDPQQGTPVPGPVSNPGPDPSSN